MSSDERSGPVRVLIAENDPRVRAALRSFLSVSPGFQVIADVGTAATALELARAHAPSVAIVGMRLAGEPPGLRLLRAVTGELRIPAVVMSPRGALRREALAAGAHAFLEEDTSPDLLLAALRAAAGREPPPG